MSDSTLLVFAHADESDAFTRANVPHLVTGIGKVNATLELTNALVGSKGVDRVVVLGTAGMLVDEVSLDRVYQIEAAVQHDYSLPSPRIVPSGDIITDTAVIATGDVFVTDDERRAALAALGAHLVDMETYAFAQVCARLGVDLQVFKTPSDFADSNTTMGDWDSIVVSKSEQLLRFADEKLPWIF